jgi:small-conductance mechanosensitive channel
MTQSVAAALGSMNPQTTGPLQIDPNALIDPTGIGWQEGVAALVTMVLAVVVASVAGRLLSRAARRWPNLSTTIVAILIRLVKWTIILLGAAFALLLLGFEVGPLFLVVLIVFAVVVVIGRPLMENFGASVVLQAEAPFHVGDLVEVLGMTGLVREISNRTTVIDTFDGRRIRVPNNQVLNSPIVNLSERGSRRAEIKVGVEYGTDLDRARAVILETMADIDAVFTEPAPEALVNEFGDSSIVFVVWFWYQPSIDHRYRTIDQVTRAVDRALRSDGIVIAFPQRVMWTRRAPTEGDQRETAPAGPPDPASGAAGDAVPPN